MFWDRSRSRRSPNIGGPKQRTVLAMLVSRAGQPLNADAIAQAVYGEDAPATARRAVQTYVSSLRSVVGDVIGKEAGGWSLVADRDAVDASRFEDLYGSARDLRGEAASEVLAEALGLWRGDPYSDVEAHGALDGEIARLAGLRISVRQARIDADLESGLAGDLIGEIEALLAEHPYQERFRAQHILALYRAGRQSEALRSYQQMRELLLDELGVDPSPDLQGLERRILEQDDSLLLTPERTADSRSAPITPASPTPASLTPSTLPVPATPLLGREEEIRRVRELMSTHRLVTLAGVGGLGKTHLALEVADREQTATGHAAHFVDLSVVSTGNDVVSAVSDVLHVRERGGGDPLRRLLAHMADKRALVVLDNCEHVIDACAELAEAALAERGEWRVLATSREVLDVAGEQVFPVPSLSAGGDGAAVGLFEARAREVNPDFGCNDADRAVIAELCERLDGMPLAIELAAARTMVMSPTEILARIDDRFRTLAPGRRRSRNRRPTLEATLDWSYDLLDPDEQHVLTVSGVFRGRFDASAVAGVVQIDEYAATELLDSLIAKSLVVSEGDGGVTGFRLLETVRAYAEGHLRRTGKLDAVRDRHLEYHVQAIGDLVDQQWHSLKPNIEAAIDWPVVCGHHSDAIELLTAAGSAWHEHSTVQSTLDRVDVLASALTPDSPLRERLLSAELQLALGVSDWERVLSTSREASKSTDPEVRINGLLMLANMTVIKDPGEAIQLLDAARATGADGDYHNHLIVGADKVRADIHMLAGEFEAALALLRPHTDAGWLLVKPSIAAALLMTGRPSEALDIAASFAPTDISAESTLEVGVADCYSAISGLCQLALGRRELAESDIVAKARSAAHGQGRQVELAANSSLIGLAALVNDDGDSVWATEMILAAEDQKFVVLFVLARIVAEQVGVREEMVRRQRAVPIDAARDATNSLLEALARWDA